MRHPQRHLLRTPCAATDPTSRCPSAAARPGAATTGTATARHTPSTGTTTTGNGSPDDYGRRVLASAGGTVVVSHYAEHNGYGNTIVIAHGNGWRTRYAHLKSRAVEHGDHVARGQRIGRVGKSSAIYDLSPHLHYEQIHDGQVVVSVIQGVRWRDFLERNQTSKNRCG